MEETNIIHPSFSYPPILSIGNFNIIDENVSLGTQCIVGNWVTLKEHTTIGSDTFIDDFVISSGNNEIGNSCSIRYQSIIARNVRIEDYCFLSAGVKTAYVPHTRGNHTKQIRIGKYAFLGDNVTVLSGVTIPEGCVIGAHSLVTKTLLKPWSVYFGVPAVLHRKLEQREIAEILQRRSE